MVGAHRVPSARCTCGETVTDRMRWPDGTVLSAKTADADGAFIFDAVPYGEYRLEILGVAGRVLCAAPVSINHPFHTMDAPISIGACATDM